MDFTYWYIFPIAFFTAIFATGSGFGGSVVFVPVFYFLGLTPAQALSTGLVTELVGMSSATSRYIRSKQVDYNIGILIILLSVPAVIIARHLSVILNPDIVKMIFGIVVFIFAIYTVLLDKQGSWGKRKKFPTEEFLPYMWWPYVGGLSIGLTSIGTCEVTNILLGRILKYDIHIAVGTAVFVNGISDLVYTILSFENIRWEIAIFSMSGVLLGGQIGPLINKYLPEKVLKIIFGIALTLVGIRMLLLSYLKLMK